MKIAVIIAVCLFATLGLATAAFLLIGITSMMFGG